jgi:hypothetical protein
MEDLLNTLDALGDALLTRKQAEPFLGVKASTQANQHSKGTGCPTIKIGSRCFYRPMDIKEFVAARRRLSSADQGGQPKEAAA